MTSLKKFDTFDTFCRSGIFCVRILSLVLNFCEGNDFKIKSSSQDSHRVFDEREERGERREREREREREKMCECVCVCVMRSFKYPS